jgi:uncharacterized membrane protein
VRNVIIFFAAVFLSLTAGRAFWVWLGENPANLSGASYVEFFQVLDRGIAIPIAVTGIGGTLLAGIASLLLRNERLPMYFLIGAFCLGFVACVVTVVVHLPINARIATWNPAALPPNYREFLDRWWRWQYVRLVSMLGAPTLVITAILIRAEPPSGLSRGV